MTRIRRSSGAAAWRRSARLRSGGARRRKRCAGPGLEGGGVFWEGLAGRVAIRRAAQGTRQGRRRRLALRRAALCRSARSARVGPLRPPPSGRAALCPRRHRRASRCVTQGAGAGGWGTRGGELPRWRADPAAPWPPHDPTMTNLTPTAPLLGPQVRFGDPFAHLARKKAAAAGAAAGAALTERYDAERLAQSGAAAQGCTQWGVWQAWARVGYPALACRARRPKGVQSRAGEAVRGGRVSPRASERPVRAWPTCAGFKVRWSSFMNALSFFQASRCPRRSRLTAGSSAVWRPPPTATTYGRGATGTA
jgi:hypothetical protein